MGATLPKPVESTVVERHYCTGFRVGIAEMNGWRSSMEDAHVIHTQADWGFFGVFDGHGGSACSIFVAQRFREALARGCPEDDAVLKKLVFSIDASFLETGQPGGSTGTMCIVHRSPGRSGRCRLRVANVGDSRVLLGRRDGNIVDGGGTDRGLTTDHKPSHPAERQRIYRCGGHVEEAAGGVARVNGELAVSRGFGDAEYKKTGGPSPEDRPVTANPEFGHFDCAQSDFLVLACDGVSEGDFPNPEVVQVVAKCLRETDDPGVAAREVVHRAIRANSKDNITCMVVLPMGSNKALKDVEYNPGPLVAPSHKVFMSAYEAMAKKVGLTLAQAAERRYERIMDLLNSPEVSKDPTNSLEEELQGFGGTPAGSRGSEERAAWFRAWEQRLPEQQAKEGGAEGPDPDAMLMHMLMSRLGEPAALGAGPNPGGPGARAGRRVRVPEVGALRKAVDEHPALEWDSRMASLAGSEGIVKADDASDGTSNVAFPSANIVAWLPTKALVPAAGPADGPGQFERPQGLLDGLAARGKAERKRPPQPSAPGEAAPSQRPGAAGGLLRNGQRLGGAAARSNLQSPPAPESIVENMGRRPSEVASSMGVGRALSSPTGVIENRGEVRRGQTMSRSAREFLMPGRGGVGSAPLAAGRPTGRMPSSAPA